ncbi:MAG TPA: hypothetical protein VF017_20290 [Thermoanaerobaculia bacterium]|nr:hypothetical protein [Thermoanaerobaculia bacterium]
MKKLAGVTLVLALFAFAAALSLPVVADGPATTAHTPGAAPADVDLDQVLPLGPTAFQASSCTNYTCNTNFDCRRYTDYYCPLGEIKFCYGGPTTDCQGACGCQ